MTTITGNRVLGYGVDDQFQIQTTQLVPLEIRLGGSQVAEATQNVYLEGTLTPSGDVADTASIIKTGILGDASYSQPPAPGAAPAASEEPGDTTSGVTADPAGGEMDPGTYYYKIVYGDGSTPPYLGTEEHRLADVLGHGRRRRQRHRPVRIPDRRLRLLQDVADLSQRGWVTPPDRSTSSTRSPSPNPPPPATPRCPPYTSSTAPATST